MKIRATYLIPFVALAVSGCASSKISNLDAYQKTPLQQTENMPSKAALSGAKSRVIVFGLEDKKWPGAGEEVSDKVSKELNATNNVVIVDRALAAKLGQEIQLAENKGPTGYKGQDVADFAITGKITAGGAGIKYTASSSYKDKNGETHYIPATCTTSGNAAFSIKIVQLPSLDVIKTLDEEATASSTQDADSGNCVRLEQAAANGIVSAAIANAVQKGHTDLQNQFAPAGYITERRQLEKSNIFKTTLGETGGAKEGLPVMIVRAVSEKNPLTGLTTTEQVTIANGVISDQIGASFSFMIIAEADKANKILLGDKVQVKYEASMSDRFNKLVH
jgi:hypothetical protein